MCCSARNSTRSDLIFNRSKWYCTWKARWQVNRLWQCHCVNFHLKHCKKHLEWEGIKSGSKICSLLTLSKQILSFFPRLCMWQRWYWQRTPCPYSTIHFCSTQHQNVANVKTITQSSCGTTIPKSVICNCEVEWNWSLERYLNSLSSLHCLNFM